MISGFKIAKDTEFRINLGKSKIAKTKAERKQSVLEEYHRIETNGISKNKIAKSIKENLEKWRKDAPSLNTIKRYLEEEGLI